MSSYLWSLLTRTRHATVFSTFRASLLPTSSYQQSRSVKFLKERKEERIQALRTEVTDNFTVNNGNIDWPVVQQTLKARGHFFRNNFEFTLISAFGDRSTTTPSEGDLSVGDTPSTPMDKSMFQQIVAFVQTSPDISKNKIAAVRFCRFLGSQPSFLYKEQVKYIKEVANTILEDDIQVPQIIIDVISALANSSASNCLYALSLLPRYLSSRDMLFRIELLHILFRSLLHYELTAELHDFTQEYGHLLELDFDLTGSLVRTFAKKAVFADEPDQLLDILRFLGTSFAPIDQKYNNALVERIIARKLGYQNIVRKAVISPHGACSVCGAQLPGLSAEDFTTLQSNFRTIIFDKNDQYLLANLAEYEVQLYEFEDQIKGPGPSLHGPKYNLIIDSLNVSYRKAGSIVQDLHGLRAYSRVFKVKDLDATIIRTLSANKILDRFEKILLIGRDHMRHWYALNKLIQQRASRLDAIFLLNRTRDDNYILYAAVQHPETKILSGDYFRDHHNKFREWYLNVEYNSTTDGQEKPNLPRIFKRWLRSRQIRLDKDDGLAVWPNEFDIKLHLAEDPSRKEQNRPALHIPIVVKADEFSNDDHIYEWICARHSAPSP